MSTDPKHYAPLIAQNLDFATTDVYLLKHGVLSVVEYDRLRKALQSGSSTNGDVVHQILPRILKEPRDFYRALRDHVNDKPEDVHPSNSELFRQLPENFVSASDHDNYNYTYKIVNIKFYLATYYFAV